MSAARAVQPMGGQGNNSRSFTDCPRYSRDGGLEEGGPGKGKLRMVANAAQSTGEEFEGEGREEMAVQGIGRGGDGSRGNCCDQLGRKLVSWEWRGRSRRGSDRARKRKSGRKTKGLTSGPSRSATGECARGGGKRIGSADKRGPAIRDSRGEGRWRDRRQGPTAK